MELTRTCVHIKQIRDNTFIAVYLSAKDARDAMQLIDGSSEFKWRRIRISHKLEESCDVKIHVTLFGRRVARHAITVFHGEGYTSEKKKGEEKIEKPLGRKEFLLNERYTITQLAHVSNHLWPRHAEYQIIITVRRIFSALHTEGYSCTVFHHSQRTLYKHNYSY